MAKNKTVNHVLPGNYISLPNFTLIKSVPTNGQFLLVSVVGVLERDESLGNNYTTLFLRPIGKHLSEALIRISLDLDVEWLSEFLEAVFKVSGRHQLTNFVGKQFVLDTFYQPNKNIVKEFNFLFCTKKLYFRIQCLGMS